MSVVTGDDLVPRLSLVTLELLKNQLVAELHSCRHPKVRISCLFKACTIVPIRFTRSDGSVFFFFLWAASTNYVPISDWIDLLALT